MRIVQISTDTLPVPPPKYGGIQRLVHSLSEELVKRGHEVYVFAPKGSTSSGTIIPYPHTGPKPEFIKKFVKENLPDNIDIIHDHTHFSLIDKLKLPVPTISNININSTTFPRYPVYISKNALQESGGNKGFCVYPGIDLTQYEFSETKKDYLLFLGEIKLQKGILPALEIARLINMKLIIAGPVYNREFFTQEVEPIIEGNPDISYIGEVGGKHKQELLKHARCLLFPITFREPFGIVMIEALACGTPVLAFDKGAVSEVLQGFPQMICHDLEDMVEKLRNQHFPAPQALRQYTEEHFSTEKMADRYLELYEKIINQELPPVHDPDFIISSYEKEMADGGSPSAKGSFEYASALKDKNQISQAINVFESCAEKADGIYKTRALYELAILYQDQGQLDMAKECCFKSFHSSLPRAEFCCRLGYCFKQEGKIDEALLWFKLATQLEKPSHRDTLYDEGCWSWVPHLELCVCYFKKKDYNVSLFHNNRAGEYIPNDKRILQNKELLEKKIAKEEKPAK
ncbi:glycosyltransferase [Rossellomorea vietnamensis]|uniref:Glycosyltransferase n=1 Tax=Rossellomorea vietnamensis TaxID=218284 RepID=A0A5D4NKP4_9BACI|nr:glycosyltransferase [Rossellomorea vietnamensis]TYS14121.1 glycosyltransferase [Rossellomorea vietnamensis]